MIVTYDAALDGASWPGPGRTAGAWGHHWVGPRGLATVLETNLGLTGPHPSNAERAAALVPVLRDTKGFWSQSTEADPLEAAATLLKWRDALIMAGWQADGGAGRLAGLAALSARMRPGLPDRLLAIRRDLAGGADHGLREVRLAQPFNTLPKLLRLLLGDLRASGVAILHTPPQPAPATGTLAAARAGRFTAEPGGNLLLLRTAGPVEAADEVAAWIAERQPGPENPVVVIGADTLLDAALRHRGLPSLGVAPPPRENLLLQLLPLTLACAASPPDPQRVLELLTLPNTPIAKALARPLADALRKWPAVGSPDWIAARDAGLAAIEDASQRERAAKRLEALFGPPAEGTDGRVDLALLEPRLGMLRQWAHARLETADEGAAAPWIGLAAQLGTFDRLVGLFGASRPHRTELAHLVERATQAAPMCPDHPAGAGMAAIAEPGALLGHAPTVVWWGFTRDSAPAVPTVPLSKAEHDWLRCHGVDLPDPGATALLLAEQWRRPLLHTADALLLVAPRHGDDGEEQFPHPLWDEIASAATNPAALVVGTLTEDRACIISTPPPAPVREWALPSGYTLTRRELESPSSIATLVSCPFKWVATYAGGLGAADGVAVPAADNSALHGSLAHLVLEHSLAHGPLPPDQAAATALALFDELSPTHAAVLHVPGTESLRLRLRTAIGHAARALHDHLRQTGIDTVTCETVRRTDAFGTVLEGRIDLLLGEEAIIDMKMGSANYRRLELESGAAVQLVMYSRLVGGGHRWPPVAYFIINQARLLATDRTTFPGAQLIEAPPLAETWAALERAHAAIWEALAAGRAPATGIATETAAVVEESELRPDGELTLAPPCRYCDYQVLCGRKFADDAD